MIRMIQQEQADTPLKFLPVGRENFYVDQNRSLRLLASLDHESQIVHEFDVKVEDGFGGSMTKSFTLQVVDNFLPIVYTENLTEVGSRHVVAVGQVVDGGGPLGVRERGS